MSDVFLRAVQGVLHDAYCAEGCDLPYRCTCTRDARIAAGIEAIQEQLVADGDPHYVTDVLRVFFEASHDKSAHQHHWFPDADQRRRLCTICGKEETIVPTWPNVWSEPVPPGHPRDPLRRLRAPKAPTYAEVCPKCGTLVYSTTTKPLTVCGCGYDFRATPKDEA